MLNLRTIYANKSLKSSRGEPLSSVKRQFFTGDRNLEGQLAPSFHISDRDSSISRLNRPSLKHQTWQPDFLFVCHLKESQSSFLMLFGLFYQPLEKLPGVVCFKLAFEITINCYFVWIMHNIFCFCSIFVLAWKYFSRNISSGAFKNILEFIKNMFVITNLYSKTYFLYIYIISTVACKRLQSLCII